MGIRRISRERDEQRSKTLPTSPSHSLSSSSSHSDFEFTISLSPCKSTTIATTIYSADELFYKGKILPLHPSPRLSMVRTLLSSSSSSSSSSSNTAASSSSARNSTGSSNDSHSSFNSNVRLLSNCESFRPSPITDQDNVSNVLNSRSPIKKNKYFSLSRFSSVFRKDKPLPKNNLEPSENEQETTSSPHAKRTNISSTAKELFKNYLKRVKPLYEILSQKQQHQSKLGRTSDVGCGKATGFQVKTKVKKEINERVSGFSYSFYGGNSRKPTARRSCPSSMRSSPNHSGLLGPAGFPARNGRMHPVDTSTMEELQSAIQGAIAHCKNSMVEQNTKTQ